MEIEKRILIVDDEQLATTLIVLALTDSGYRVDSAASVEEALRQCREIHYDLVIVDVMMPFGPLGWMETKGGFETGIALARRIRALSPRSKLVGITQVHRPAVAQWFESFADGLWKKNEVLTDPAVAAKRVGRLLTGAVSSRLTAFIVHGHALTLRDELRQFLLGSFAGMSVLVLDEQPWFAQTVIEKFERVASDVDIVFVLLTGDDVTIDVAGRSELRARQNVFVELGYFMGRFTRSSGRIVMLATRDVAMPSDLDGIGVIDISDGIAAAASSITRELTRVINGG